MVDLAIAVEVNRSRCSIRRLGSVTPVEARLSRAMAERSIFVRPGDLVRVNFDFSPPEVVYRWRKATVVAVQEDSMTIATVPSDEDLSMSAWAPTLPSLRLEHAVGDTVFVDVRHRQPVVIDGANQGEPQHPHRFGEHYAGTRDEIRAVLAVNRTRSDSTRMHADELDISSVLVRQLLRAQRPQWADLPLHRVPSSGTDNAMFRMGEQLVARLPRIGWAVDAVEHEHRWLPVIAPRLQLAVPVPQWKGEPGEGYPWPWSVYRWLDGEGAFSAKITDFPQAAKDLAGFIKALQAIDATNGPPVLGGKSAPLATASASMRRSIAAAEGLVDTEAVAAAWEETLRAPRWQGSPVWIHRDLASSNLLVHDGRIVSVIDWSAVAVGDPAADVRVAWELFDAESRDVFRAELNVDDATWRRARGWALMAVTGLSYYLHTNPDMVTRCRRTVAGALADFASDP
jgi:aminoglycoside phosphotransferase (APT) family kinase protein